MTYEYQCKKCNKKIEHFLKITHKCDCGGVYKCLDKPFKYSDIAKWKNIYPDGGYFSKSQPPLKQKPDEFIPVRYYGGKGDIWYYRKKSKKK